MNKLLGIDIYRVDTTPTAELGSVVEDVRGGQGDLAGLGYDVTRIRYYDPGGQYCYVKASGVGGILNGDAVIIDVAAADEPGSVVRTVTTTAGQRVFGVALVDIPQNSYGYVQIRGRVPFAASATAALRKGVRIAAAGVAADATLGTTAAGTAGELALLAAVTVPSSSGRRIMALDASADDGSTTQLRVEALILG